MPRRHPCTKTGTARPITTSRAGSSAKGNPHHDQTRTTATDDPGPLRRYLLGDLPEAERDELEVELLAGGESYRALLAEEDDLIDDYVRGTLNQAERAAFEASFLPRPGIADRLAFARTLETATHRAAEAGTAESVGAAQRATALPWSERLGAWLGGLMPAPALRLAGAAAALALVAVAAFALWQGVALRQQVAQLEHSQQSLAGERADLAQREQELGRQLAEARHAADLLRADDNGSGEELAAAAQRIDELEGEVTRLRRLPKPRREPLDVSFMLALATRGAGVPELAVPAAADTVVACSSIPAATTTSRTTRSACSAPTAPRRGAAPASPPTPPPARWRSSCRRRSSRPAATRRCSRASAATPAASWSAPTSSSSGASPDAGSTGRERSPGGGHTAPALFSSALKGSSAAIRRRCFVAPEMERPRRSPLT